jgi:hypothetical protein
MRPSVTPSAGSQLAIARWVASASFAVAIGAPRSTFITSCGQIW